MNFNAYATPRRAVPDVARGSKARLVALLVTRDAARRAFDQLCLLVRQPIVQAVPPDLRTGAQINRKSVSHPDLGTNPLRLRGKRGSAVFNAMGEWLLAGVDGGWRR